MAAGTPIVGDTEIIVNATTRRLPAQIKKELEATKPIFRKEGEEMGAELVDGMTKKYPKEYVAMLRKANKDALQEDLKFYKQLNASYRVMLDDREKTIAKHNAEVADSGKETGRKFADNFTKESKKGLKANGPDMLGFLDDQAKAIAGIIVATFGPASGLASGLAASLVALGGSLLSSLTALSSVAAALPGLGYGFALASSGLGRVEELAPKAAAGIKDLKSAFEDADVPRFMKQWESSLAEFTHTLANSLRFDQIAEGLGNAMASITSAFTGVLQSPAWTAFVQAMETIIPQAIANFGIGIAGVTEAFLAFSAAAGPALGVISNGFKQWGIELAAVAEQALADGSLTNFLIQATTSIELLMGFLGPLAQGLANVFFAGTETGNMMLALLGQLAEQFLSFTQSVEGQQALQQWFDAGFQIFQALLPLIGAVGTALADIVTPEVVGIVTTFLGQLTQFIPVLGQVLSVVTQLNVLGIVGELLTAIGTALTPVMPLLSELAAALGAALVQAIVALTPLLSSAVAAIASLAPLFVELLPPVVAIIETLSTSLAPILDDLAVLYTDLIEAIAPLLPQIADLLIPIIEMLAANLSSVVPILGTLLPSVIKTLVTTIGPMLTVLTRLAEWLLPIVEENTKYVADIFRVLAPVVSALTDLFNAWISPLSTVFNSLADGKGILQSIKDGAVAFGKAVADAFAAVKRAISSIKWPTPPAWLSSAAGWIGSRFATGGLVTGPTRALIGEAGPEMVIPLARPLSMVDPAVREVAAFAQGKLPSYASGGVVGGGVNIAAGAIQIVTPYANPARVAEEVMDSLVLAGK